MSNQQQQQQQQQSKATISKVRVEPVISSSLVLSTKPNLLNSIQKRRNRFAEIVMKPTTIMVDFFFIFFGGVTIHFKHSTKCFFCESKNHATCSKTRNITNCHLLYPVGYSPIRSAPNSSWPTTPLFDAVASRNIDDQKVRTHPW